MEKFKLDPVTISELELWNKDKLTNPRTKRSIKLKSRLYNYFEKNYKEQIESSLIDKEINGDYLFQADRENNVKNNCIDSNIQKKIKELIGPVYDDITLSFDPKDVISQIEFWEIDNKNNRIPLYNNKNHLVSYYDSEKRLRCFEITTIIDMIDNNMLKHPITNENLPEEFINRSKDLNNLLIKNDMIEEKVVIEKTIEDLAFDLFQKLGNGDIYLDKKYFLDLSIDKLDKLYYETREFYFSNISSSDRVLIENNSKIFIKSRSDLRNDFGNDISKIQKYIIENFMFILTNCTNNTEYIVKYIILAGLNLVIPEVKEKYPDFEFSFQ